MRLAGRTALVTGASRGIGRAAALELAREGADVVVHCHRRQAEAESLAEEIRALGRAAVAVAGDVADVAEVGVVAEVTAGLCAGRGLHVLFNNAGIYPPSTLASTSPEEWDLVMAVNVRGPFLVTQALLPALRDAGGASVINIGSVIPGLGIPGLLSYAASKGAVVGFTHCLSRELAADGIRVNCIVPSMVATATALEGHADSVEPIVASQSVGRLQLPEDVTGAVVFLASDDSAFMTGQTMVVDGGRWLL